ncbi:hypothetical protein KQI63_08290 [bacterium]|nr:hypothetical protein [bacterium]
MKRHTALLLTVLLLAVSFLGCPPIDGPRHFSLDMSLYHGYTDPASFVVVNPGFSDAASFRVDNYLVNFEYDTQIYELELGSGRFHPIEWTWDQGSLVDTLDLGFVGKPMLRVNDLPIEVGSEVQLPATDSYTFAIEIPTNGHSPVPQSWPTSYDNQLVLEWTVKGQHYKDELSLPFDRYERTFDNLTALDEVELRITKQLFHDLSGYGTVGYSGANLSVDFDGNIEFPTTRFRIRIPASD